MFNVVVNDGTQELPDDDIYYIVAKEGIFLKKKIGVMESIAPVKNISILQSVNTMARMYINPLPAQYGAKVLEFFKAVFEKFGGEAIVLLFYNEKTGKYKVVPPTQKVTAAACDYNRGVTVEGFTMIGTIHSHANFSAFHSGVDDADEKTFDGLHITYGNVMSEEFSLSASIVANGSRFIVNPEDYMLGLSKTKDIDEEEVYYSTRVYKVDPKTSKMVLDEAASSKSAYSKRKLDKRYLFKVSASKRQFNPKWMNLVERGTYTYNYSGYYGGLYGGNRWQGHGSRWNGSRWNNWGGHYDGDLWKQAGRFVAPGAQKQIPFVGTAPVTPPAVVTPEKAKDCEPSNPCLSCKNRVFKIMDEMEDVDYQEEMYHCEKCKVLFTTTDAEPKCPTCKTDMYLNYIDEKDLKNNHSVGDPQVIDDREAALNSAQSMEMPDQQGYMQCLECGNTFLKLSSDECCPYCQTLLPDTVKVSDDDDDDIEWQCPHCKHYFTEDDMLNANECPWCYGLVDLFFDDEREEKIECPRCHIEVLSEAVAEKGKCPRCQMIFSVQMTDSLNQSQADSGAFLDQSDEEHQAILDAAAEADRTLERIPDPEKGPYQPKPFSQTIIDKMRKVFGGGNDGSMH